MSSIATTSVYGSSNACSTDQKAAADVEIIWEVGK